MPRTTSAAASHSHDPTAVHGNSPRHPPGYLAMPTLTTDDGQTWDLTAPQLANVRTLASLPPTQLEALVDLARAQAQLDAARSIPARPSLRVVNSDGTLVHPFNCRNAKMHETRGEPVPACRWVKDTAGGYSCAECGTWAKPDSERARVLDGLGRSRPIAADDLCKTVDAETEAALFGEVTP